jgi:protein SCO1/2
MKLARPILIIAALAIALGAAVFAFRGAVFDRAPEPSLIGGPFQMVDQNGKAADQTLLQGKWSAVFFGFTYCPDVCPATLQALSAAVPMLTPAQAKKLQIVFVSVDPERDTPAQMKAYLDAQRLPVGTVGLTGTPAQVAATAKAYRVFYEKAGEGDSYTMNHSTAVYLMDPKGRFDRVLAFGLTPAQMADQIKEAMSR